QRHHGEMHGAAADRFATVVAAELNWVLAPGNPVVCPVEFRLFGFIRRKIIERPEPWSGIQADNGEPVFRESASQGAAPRAGADDHKVHFLIVAVLPHRHPGPGTEYVRRAAIGA